VRSSPTSATEPVVYVVAGFPRTGTSVTVHAIHEGGIPAVVAPRRIERRPGYVLQPATGYWQASKAFWRRPMEVKGAAGRVVKFLLHADGLEPPSIRGVRYRIVVLLRPLSEVRASMRAAAGRRTRYTPAQAVSWARKQAGRPDVASVSVLRHRSLMMAPGDALEALGWPIDAEKAARAVDPAWWRHRA